MIHKRIVTMEGHEDWIKRTLQNSLPEGFHAGIFGGNQSINITTIEGNPVLHAMPKNKPEIRFEYSENVKIHLLMFDDGSGTGRIEKASLSGMLINRLVDESNGGPGMESGPYFATSVDLE